MVAVFALASLAASQTMVSAPQTAPVHEPGAAESLYLQLNSVGLDATRVFKVRGASIDRGAIHITLEDGNIAFTKDVMGKITGAFFEGRWGGFAGATR